MMRVFLQEGIYNGLHSLRNGWRDYHMLIALAGGGMGEGIGRICQIWGCHIKVKYTSGVHQGPWVLDDFWFCDLLGRSF